MSPILSVDYLTAAERHYVDDAYESMPVHAISTSRHCRYEDYFITPPIASTAQW